jgi:hypothetical protein
VTDALDYGPSLDDEVEQVEALIGAALHIGISTSLY